LHVTAHTEMSLKVRSGPIPMSIYLHGWLHSLELFSMLFGRSTIESLFHRLQVLFGKLTVHGLKKAWCRPLDLKYQSTPSQCRSGAGPRRPWRIYIHHLDSYLPLFPDMNQHTSMSVCFLLPFLLNDSSLSCIQVEWMLVRHLLVQSWLIQVICLTL
jgi:hypothetical protein